MNEGKVKSISAVEPDWDRERLTRFWDPSRQLLRAIRSYQKIEDNGNAWIQLRKKWLVAKYRFWSVVTGAEIDLSANIQGGLLLPHPNGIVVHPNAVIGPNCLIFQQVTIGTGGRHDGVPTIGGHVDMGAGAKILGGVVIGNHARVGANSVVIDHVPDWATAIGIPARMIVRNEENKKKVNENEANPISDCMS